MCIRDSLQSVEAVGDGVHLLAGDGGRGARRGGGRCGGEAAEEILERRLRATGEADVGADEGDVHLVEAVGLREGGEFVVQSRLEGGAGPGAEPFTIYAKFFANEQLHGFSRDLRVIFAFPRAGAGGSQPEAHGELRLRQIFFLTDELYPFSHFHLMALLMAIV